MSRYNLYRVIFYIKYVFIVLLLPYLCAEKTYSMPPPKSGFKVMDQDVEAHRHMPIMQGVSARDICEKTSLITVGFIAQERPDKTLQWGDHAYIYFSHKEGPYINLEGFHMASIQSGVGDQSQELNPYGGTYVRVTPDGMEEVVKKFSRAVVEAEVTQYDGDRFKKTKKIIQSPARYHSYVSFGVPSEDVTQYVSGIRYCSKEKVLGAYVQGEFQEAKIFEGMRYRKYGHFFKQGRGYNCCTFVHKILGDCGIVMPSGGLAKGGKWLRRNIDAYCTSIKKQKTLPEYPKIFKHYLE